MLRTGLWIAVVALGVAGAEPLAAGEFHILLTDLPGRSLNGEDIGVVFQNGNGLAIEVFVRDPADPRITTRATATTTNVGEVRFFVDAANLPAEDQSIAIVFSRAGQPTRTVEGLLANLPAVQQAAVTVPLPKPGCGHSRRFCRRHCRR
ncbi:MAG: hypothetical protein HYS13_16395 [Planctomycetia bacterium]|nr:hypothetical protein [Planctomycetia bacterium]